MKAQAAVGLVVAMLSGGAAAQQPVDRAACERAKRDYELAASSVTMTKAQREARLQTMYVACGIQPPNRTSINVHINR